MEVVNSTQVTKMFSTLQISTFWPFMGQCSSQLFIDHTDRLFIRGFMNPLSNGVKLYPPVITPVGSFQRLSRVILQIMKRYKWFHTTALVDISGQPIYKLQGQALVQESRAWAGIYVSLVNFDGLADESLAPALAQSRRQSRGVTHSFPESGFRRNSWSICTELLNRVRVPKYGNIGKPRFIKWFAFPSKKRFSLFSLWSSQLEMTNQPRHVRGFSQSMGNIPRGGIGLETRMRKEFVFIL